MARDGGRGDHTVQIRGPPARRVDGSRGRGCDRRISCLRGGGVRPQLAHLGNRRPPPACGRHSNSSVPAWESILRGGSSTMTPPARPSDCRIRLLHCMRALRARELTASSGGHARGTRVCPRGRSSCSTNQQERNSNSCSNPKTRERRLGRRQRQTFGRRVVGFRTGKRSERISA